MEKPRSKKKERQEQEEGQYLDLAAPLLKTLYGDYTVDPVQNDKPDKAIFLLKPPARFGKRRKIPPCIGIEITSADPSEYQRYMNERKSDKDVLVKHVADVMESGKPSNSPLKKAANIIYHAWIFDGIKKKLEKYQGYKESGKFEELVLVCSSDVIGVGSRQFLEGLREWTNHLLSINECPYDKVILIGSDNKAVQVYNKSQPLMSVPAIYVHEGSVITSIQYGMVPMGEAINLYEVASAEPVIVPEIPLVDRS